MLTSFASDRKSSGAAMAAKVVHLVEALFFAALIVLWYFIWMALPAVAAPALRGVTDGGFIQGSIWLAASYLGVAYLIVRALRSR